MSCAGVIPSFKPWPSMKVPPKRKGNSMNHLPSASHKNTLNESPSEKEGKSRSFFPQHVKIGALNESPSEKEGKLGFSRPRPYTIYSPSMKVPPKRKGNLVSWADPGSWSPLNESPSEKEGKLAQAACIAQWRHPSMKVPPKRKGNWSVVFD